MHADDLGVDEGRDWQPIETNSKLLPHLQVVLALALIIKAVNSIDRATFVVTPKQEHSRREFNLVSEEQADRLNRLLAPIHVIAKEEILAVHWLRRIYLVGVAHHVEEAEEIDELTVDVAKYFAGSVNLYQYLLLLKNLSGL